MADARVIDGAVNVAGYLVAGVSAVLRLFQTGSVRSYAASTFVGVVRDSRLLPLEMMLTGVPILTLLVALPVLGALLLLVLPNRDGSKDQTMRLGALGISLVTFVLSLALWAAFDQSAAAPAFQFVERHAWIPTFGIEYYLGLDGISLMLVVLTTFLTPIALLSGWEGIHERVKEFSIFMLLLEAAMIGVFVSLDLFLFYVFWDVVLIPMYFLIGIWGYDQRLYASIKFLLYTMAGSVLMLVAIIGVALAAPAGDRAVSVRPAEALRAARARSRCSTGSSWPSRWPSPSRCRSSRSTRGCPTRTCRRRRRARSSWPACC